MSDSDCFIDNIDDTVAVNKLLLYIKINGITDVNILINKILLDYIDENYKDEGYIYCIYNEVYDNYGDNVHKIGCC